MMGFLYDDCRLLNRGRVSRWLLKGLPRRSSRTGSFPSLNMKNVFLGLAFAGLALVSCQNPSSNNMESAGSPASAAACPMGDTCDMGEEACDMDAKSCDMDAAGAKDCGDCDMSAMPAGTCPMEGKN